MQRIIEEAFKRNRVPVHKERHPVVDLQGVEQKCCTTPISDILFVIIGCSAPIRILFAYYNL